MLIVAKITYLFNARREGQTTLMLCGVFFTPQSCV
ncbi:hypothetical protein MNBD_NITROSPINAE04-636 [hydrothermal vent metagenome]|uniref:Uncharacterized protein n=1 Tax=hydrothermal vent metagenome TaxID=652676 RepID=A0A3B1CAL5_9ZZZZ